MSQTLQFLIDEERAGRRLDEFLASELVALSRMRIANLIAAGACVVNREQAGPGYHLRPGDLIEITISSGPPTSMDPEPIPLEILYEDANLLVVVKPSGMLVHPTRSVKRGTLANALAHHLNFKFEISDLKSIVRPGIVHRLDRDTSGLMVVAKTQRALSILSRHFNRRLVRKRYVAIVEGSVSADEGAISAPIGRVADARPHWRVTEEGKPAETRFRVLERRGAATLLELEPVTGRTNQLRIHCAWAGHPILGDRLYSNTSAERLCLHASELAFHHPAGGEWMEFHSPMPPDITKVLRGRLKSPVGALCL
ncbi:MAG TPA: RluA family pseudouridine synthase [Blastocatellia bacterium]|nr:RluA family pseudouridine synthase [Blastocatellia bacterium]